MIHERNIFLVVAVSVIIGFFIGTAIAGTTIYYPTNSFSERQIILAAVDDLGNGVAVPLKVEVKHGDGKVLTDIDKLLFWIDTQYSMQVARDVTENITKIDTSDFDLIYSIEANTTGIVGGPSAGAALTVATIAALTNKTIRQDVLMTGTINEDGSIGKVGGVLEKAKAAKDIGAKIFVVPKGQGTEIRLIPKESCTRNLGFIYCETRYEEEIINIGKDTGIAVIEVERIEDAMNYFFE